MNPRVGIVVPTLGTRPEFLEQCLKSIREAGDAYILLVAPTSLDVASIISGRLADGAVLDPGSGLPEAINLGIAKLPASVEHINWLGDDDLLIPGSITKAQKALDRHLNSVMVFGSCDYIDQTGKVVWRNRSGQWAVPLLRFGPDLVPQPGSLFRRSAFEKVGRLSQAFDWAFDFDLFIKLAKLGKLTFIDQTLAQFRWHPESLSVEFRRQSVAEASRVRVSHLPKLLRPISWLWEFAVMQATLIAGSRVTTNAKKKAQQP